MVTNLLNKPEKTITPAVFDEKTAKAISLKVCNR